MSGRPRHQGSRGGLRRGHHLDFCRAERARVDLQIAKLAVEGAVHAGAETQRGFAGEVPSGGGETSALGDRLPIHVQGEPRGGLHGGDVMPTGGQPVVPGDLATVPCGPDFAGGQRAAKHLARVLGHRPDAAIFHIGRMVEALPERPFAMAIVGVGLPAELIQSLEKTHPAPARSKAMRNPPMPQKRSMKRSLRSVGTPSTRYGGASSRNAPALA